MDTRFVFIIIILLVLLWFDEGTEPPLDLTLDHPARCSGCGLWRLPFLAAPQLAGRDLGNRSIASST